MLLHFTITLSHKIIEDAIGKTLIFNLANPDFMSSSSYTT